MFRFLFWSDSNRTASKIERSDLAGNQRIVLVSSSSGHNMVFPTKIVVDINNQKLFWLDAAASSVGSCDYDGSSVTLWTQSNFALMSSMTLYKVCWTVTGRV
jgi:hypothetical protein